MGLVFRCLSVSMFLAVGTLCFAQDVQGILLGSISDVSGAPVRGAQVAADLLGSENSRQVSSNENGSFRMNDLAPGQYRVRISAPGLEQAEATISIEVRSTREISVTLRPATLKQAVNVQADDSSITTAPVDTTSSVQGGVVATKDLETIPLASRSFANIAFMVPGTEPVEPSDPTKARITAVSFGGSSGLNDVLSVDGGDNSDDYIGGFLQNFSPDGIQEFAVQTAQRMPRQAGQWAGRLSSPQSVEPMTGMASERFMSAPRHSMRAIPLKIPPRCRSNLSHGRIMWPLSVAQSLRTNYGSFPPMKACAKRPVSRTVQRASRNSTL